jgi:Transposase DDE domain group 1
MRAIVGRDGFDRGAASRSQMGRFETEWLATDANLEALTDLSGTWIDRVHARKAPEGIILEMDSSEGPTHGEQEGSAWNGHFGCTSYHPLFLFQQFGDLQRCLPRPGHVHSADDWRACWSGCSPATESAVSTYTSGPTQRSLSRSCTRPWKPRTSSTPSVCRRTGADGPDRPPAHPAGGLPGRSHS